MVSFVQNIALSLAIAVISGDQNIHLDSEKANFGILEMKIDGNWVTGMYQFQLLCTCMRFQFVIWGSIIIQRT